MVMNEKLVWWREIWSCPRVSGLCNWGNDGAILLKIKDIERVSDVSMYMDSESWNQFYVALKVYLSYPGRGTGQAVLYVGLELWKEAWAKGQWHIPTT